MRYLIVLVLCVISLSIQAKPNARLSDTLDVAVYLSPPFASVDEQGIYYGLSIDVWESIAKRLNLPYRYHTQDMHGLLSGLEASQYDLGLGAITIIPEREVRIDFSHAVNPSGTGFAVSAKGTNTFSTFWKPILLNLLELLGVLLIGIVLSGSLIWLVESRYREPVRVEKHIRGLGESIWWAIVTMSTVGYGDKVPLSKIGKGIAVVWIFTSLILVALFTARASSTFTITELKLKIETENDLRSVKVGAAKNSSGAKYCHSRNIPYHAYEDIETALEDLANERIEAVVSNVPVIQHYKNSRFKNDIIVSPYYLQKNNMGIAFPDNSALLEPVNQTLLELIRNPQYHMILQKYLGK